MRICEAYLNARDSEKNRVGQHLTAALCCCCIVLATQRQQRAHSHSHIVYVLILQIHLTPLYVTKTAAAAATTMPLRRYEAPSITKLTWGMWRKKSTSKHKYYYLINAPAATIMITITTMANNNKWQKEIEQTPMRQQTVLGIREPARKRNRRHTDPSNGPRLRSWKRAVWRAHLSVCGRWSEGRQMPGSIQNQLIMIRIANAYKLNSTVATTLDVQSFGVAMAL